jgi:hypothetical protein
MNMEHIGALLAQHAQEVIELTSQMHTTVIQAEGCLQQSGGFQQLTASGLADSPSLGTAVRRTGSNELLDRATCLATPAEQLEDSLQEELVRLEEGSNSIAG